VHEQASFDVVLAGFVLCLLLAYALELFMARKVMQPLSRLARQVHHRDRLHPLAPTLPPDYPDTAAFAWKMRASAWPHHRTRRFFSPLRAAKMLVVKGGVLVCHWPDGSAPAKAGKSRWMPPEPSAAALWCACRRI